MTSVQDTDRTKRDALSVSEAAEALGLSVDAVRKRLQRGGLRGEKVGGRWVVYLDTDRTEPDMSRTKQDSDRALGSDLAAVVEAQERHIETLERELEQRNSELRAMHLQVERLTRALPAPEDSEKDESVGRQSWWSRWFGGREK